MIFCHQGHQNSFGDRFCRQCGAALNPAVSSTPSGEVVGQMLGWRYLIVQELGQGGFGRTYLAKDSHRFNESCVVKEFAPQVQGTEALQKAEELFAREAGVLYRLQHPQIPRFRELFRADLPAGGRLFLVQDYVEGQTYEELLRSRHTSGQSFTEAEATELLHQLLPVLTYIHTIGVVHRDISPDNLMLRTPDRLPVLIDFGGVKQIAKTVMHQVNPAIAPTGKVTRLGKAGYAPAEQMEQGDVSPHSDLYALAVTILVLLTGKEPEAALGSDRRQWQRDLNLSPPLVTVLDRMLAPFPQKRYQSAAEVLQALPKGTHATTPNVVNPNMATSNAATSNAVNPQAAAHSIYQPTVAIAPINRTVAHVPASQSTPRPPRSSSSRSIGGIVTFILLLLVAGASIGGFWMANQLVKPFGKSNSPKPKPANSTTQGQSQAIPEISEREQKRKQTLDQQRQQLGIDEAFLVQLTDETFYRRRAIGRALSNSPADESLRTEWDGMAKQALDRLEKLSSETRSRLGNYTEADLATRRNAAAQLNLSSRAFNDLTDARFFALFPDQPRDADLVQQPIGQVWQAIAAEQLKALQTGTTIERLKPNTQQLNGKLKPGEGKIYLASLIKNQPLQLRLEAAAATRLSFYPPTNKSALLEDSTEQQWSGKLPESGWYELVIVSDAKKTVEYTIDLATNN